MMWRNYSPSNLIWLADNWSDGRSAPGCFAGQGRAFDVSLTNLDPTYTAVNLQGISVLFHVAAASARSFDWGILRLTLVSGAKESLIGKDLSDVVRTESVAAVTDPAVFPRYQDSVTDIYSSPVTYEVLFKLPPRLIKRGQTYTALLECQTGNLNNIYSVWQSQRMGGVGAVAAFDGRSVKSYGYNDSVLHSLYGEKSLLFHPVILVHELGGSVTDFQDKGFFDLLRGENFNPDFVKVFDFGSEGGQYKSNVELPTLVQKFADDLVRVAADYQSQGGDGKVDVVAFGSGNLIAKDYLSRNPRQSRVRRYISVGGLNKGSWLLDRQSHLAVADDPAMGFNARVAELFVPLLNELNLLSSGRPPTSTAVLDQLRSDSAVVGRLLDEGRLPTRTEVGFHNLVGNINVRVRQPLFHFQVSGVSSLGDGAVTRESSRLNCPPEETACLTVFGEDLGLLRRLRRGGAESFSYSGDLPSLETLKRLKFIHSKLMESVEIQSEIKRILSNL